MKHIKCPFCEDWHIFKKGVSKIRFFCPTADFEIYLDIFSKKDQDEFYTKKH